MTERPPDPAALKPEVDLIVVGAGAGGMTAALVAALEGLDVLLCEATEQVGGTTATSAGTIWVPATRASREAGFEDSIEDAMRYLDGLVPSGEGRALREAYLRSGPAIVDELARRTQLQFVPAGRHPDYVDIPGSRVFGRALAPLPFDGRKLGAEFGRIRAPMREFMVLGGMMVGKADIGHLVGRFKSWASFRHSAALVLRYLGDRVRHARGTRLVMGNALVARFYASLRDAGVEVSFGTRLDALLEDERHVAGARLLRGGQSFDVRARRGVVLATGGFGRDARLREQLMPPGHARWPSLVFEGNQGDGVRAGMKAGAALDGATGGAGVFWQPVSVTRPRRGPTGLFAHLFLDRAKPGLIAVDTAGMRFTNEGGSYHYFCQDMVARHATTPAIPAWVVCDAAFVHKYGLGLVHPGTTDLQPHVKSGYLTCAETIEGLAQAIGVDAQGLRDSVARNNEFARTGVDADFGKGSTEVSRFNGDLAHGPNPCLGPIAQAPFCAMALWPADAAADAGLRTDEDARVLDAGGRAIEGLYAVGNDMASAMRGAYPGPGTTIGPAMVFGYRAAMHARISAGKP
ncbi:3-oxosteroid 1-dehydrogenase [Variovorax sp. PBL-H6]|uniref:FAD-dependent oxidoreductase n=1 Tax=Variovorax sp. PBL-H6 TaxID=434009 RepID=UPI00131909ED|nr:FAD-dependent oxidoreductase [Variovorax sp. PBL-H6]VTU31836.1 3-oxosteroid 1-dehydrogenase [Variovorax sp. PBL-H6]